MCFSLFTNTFHTFSVENFPSKKLKIFTEDKRLGKEQKQLLLTASKGLKYFKASLVMDCGSDSYK
jgi:hypothetical protein